MKKLKFSEFDISGKINRALDDMGFEGTTPIQALTLPVTLDGMDVVGEAQTGTGKTAAFAIPLLENLEPERVPQALVICPTRELCLQVTDEIRRIGKYLNVRVLAVYGGQGIGGQIAELRRGVHVIVATPGRLIDHIERGTVDLGGISTVVLDEADEMLNMGFIEDIERILSHVPERRQTMLFSATISKPVLRIAERYMRSPQILRVEKKHSPRIDEFYFKTREEDKVELLDWILTSNDIRMGLIFCNTKRRVQRLRKQLGRMGYSVDEIHGDLSQSKRERVMERFRKGRFNLLIATDVAARGIHVPDVEVVVNYDLPFENEYYVHRIGRTGRAGSSGKSFTLVVGREVHRLRRIQSFTGKRIKKSNMPSPQEIRRGYEEDLVEVLRRNLKSKSYSDSKLLGNLVSEGYSFRDISHALLDVLESSK
ncbi:DEAD/DEAH box helicase [Methanothermobacter sp.]|uniref:DEAD/DEAH box helicase n=1 Tax=Methanothermobacter sp. TaxID=1884223 RepID=UPI003C74E30A